jgi:hypothetical protein
MEAFTGSGAGRLMTVAALAATLAGCAATQSPGQGGGMPAPAPAPGGATIPADVKSFDGVVSVSPAPAPTRAPTPVSDPRPPSPSPSPATVVPQPVDITPLHEFNEQWTSGPTADGADFSGQYTRLVITSSITGNNSGGQVPALAYKPRNWLSRAIMGKEFNYVLTAKLRVPDTMEFTVPLAIIGHQSNSDGETWLRELSVERRDFPLFLVKRDGRSSNPSISAEVKGSNTYASRGAAAGVSALARLTQLTGASPTVVTQLTKESAKTAAAQVDAALSRLLTTSVTERTNSDRPLRNWPPQSFTTPTGLQIVLKVPEDERWDDAGPKEVGRWTITFDAPRPSIFSDWSVCKTASLRPRCSATVAEARSNVTQEVRPAEILNFDLVNGAQKLGTIRAYLVQQEWFTTAITAFANPNVGADTVNLFCRRVVNEITGLDLSEFDAKLVLWATYKAMPVTFPASFASAADCKPATDQAVRAQ